MLQLAPDRSADVPAPRAPPPAPADPRGWGMAKSRSKSRAASGSVRIGSCSKMPPPPLSISTTVSRPPQPLAATASRCCRGAGPDHRSPAPPGPGLPRGRRRCERVPSMPEAPRKPCTGPGRGRRVGEALPVPHRAAVGQQHRQTGGQQPAEPSGQGRFARRAGSGSPVQQRPAPPDPPAASGRPGRWRPRVGAGPARWPAAGPASQATRPAHPWTFAPAGDPGAAVPLTHQQLGPPLLLSQRCRRRLAGRGPRRSTCGSCQRGRRLPRAVPPPGSGRRRSPGPDPAAPQAGEGIGQHRPAAAPLPAPQGLHMAGPGAMGSHARGPPPPPRGGRDPGRRQAATGLVAAGQGMGP